MNQEKHSTKRTGWKQLSEKERYQIEALRKAKNSCEEIARQLGRNRRSIEREIRRGSVQQRDSELRERMCYCADAGQRVAKERAANKGRGLKIGHDHALAAYIEGKIRQEKYAPDAVIGELRAKGWVFETSICTKTLYNYIDQGVFAGISNKDLPVKRDKKKRPYRRIRKVALTNLKGRNIEDRPEEIERREEFGHWEMDCVVGCGKACLLVLTERKSRQELIFKMPRKTQANVIQVMNKLEQRYRKGFSQVFKSITMDNGCEFLDSHGLETSVVYPGKGRTTCYYAHPYSAWERGSNENANKLIRRFVPKGMDIGKLSLRQVSYIQLWMNNYPRRILGYQSPNSMFAAFSD